MGEYDLSKFSCVKAQGEKYLGKFMLKSGEFALCLDAALNDPLIYN